MNNKAKPYLQDSQSAQRSGSEAYYVEIEATMPNESHPTRSCQIEIQIVLKRGRRSVVLLRILVCSVGSRRPKSSVGSLIARSSAYGKPLCRPRNIIAQMISLLKTVKSPHRLVSVDMVPTG